MPNFKRQIDMKTRFLTALILLTSFISYGQNHKTIEIDPITDMAKESLPFDQSFVLKKTYSNKIEIIGVGYYEIKHSEINKYFNIDRTANLNLRFKFEENKDKKHDLYILFHRLNLRNFMTS